MKYAACAFRDKLGERVYDYAVGFEVKPGDVIKVPDKHGGWNKVYVRAVNDSTNVKPEFIKEAIGIYEPEAESNGG